MRVRFATTISGSPESVGAKVDAFKDDIQDLAVQTGTSTIADGMYRVLSAFGETGGELSILGTNTVAAVAGLASAEESAALTSAVTKAYGDTTAEAVQKAADLAFQTV